MHGRRRRPGRAASSLERSGRGIPRMAWDGAAGDARLAGPATTPPGGACRSRRAPAAGRQPAPLCPLTCSGPAAENRPAIPGRRPAIGTAALGWQPRGPGPGGTRGSIATRAAPRRASRVGAGGGDGKEGAGGQTRLGGSRGTSARRGRRRGRRRPRARAGWTCRAPAAARTRRDGGVAKG